MERPLTLSKHPPLRRRSIRHCTTKGNGAQHMIDTFCLSPIVSVERERGQVITIRHSSCAERVNIRTSLIRKNCEGLFLTRVNQPALSSNNHRTSSARCYSCPRNSIALTERTEKDNGARPRTAISMRMICSFVPFWYDSSGTADNDFSSISGYPHQRGSDADCNASNDVSYVQRVSLLR